MTGVSVVLSIATALLAVFFGVTILNLHSSDAAGNAYAIAWAVAEFFVLWTLLGILLSIAAVRGGLPGWSKWIVFALYVVAGASELASLRMADYRGSSGLLVACLRVALIVSPVLLLVRAGFGTIPALGRSVSPDRITWWIAVPLLLLSLPPWLPLLRLMREIKAVQAEDAVAVQKADEEHNRIMQAVNEQSLLEVRALPASAPLSQVIVYSTTDYVPLRDAARERARTLVNRQAAAEEMINRGEQSVLRELAYLNLADTPALCQGARQVLHKIAQDLVPSQPDLKRAWFDEVEWQVDPYRASIEWLASHGCDIGAELALFEEVVLRSKATPKSERFQSWLTELKLKAQAR